MEHERERDVSARLALGAYLVRRLVHRMLAHDEGSCAQEGMLWQLDAVRRHLRELPADSPESAHLHGITDAIPVGPHPLASLRLSLMAYAYFLEHEGRLEEAIEVLALAVRTHGADVPVADFAGSALFAGRINRLLARWPEAAACYSAAESAAEQAGDTVLTLRARLGRGAVLRGPGQSAARAQVAEEVAAAAHRAGLREVEAMAYADLGSVLSNEGRQVEAVQAIYQPFLLTRGLLQRTRVARRPRRGAGGDRGVRRGAHGVRYGARLQDQLRRADQRGARADGHGVVGRATGWRSSGAGPRRDAARTRMPPSMLADFYYKAGVGLARFGQLGRARDTLLAGQAHSREASASTPGTSGSSRRRATWQAAKSASPSPAPAAAPEQLAGRPRAWRSGFASSPCRRPSCSLPGPRTMAVGWSDGPVASLRVQAAEVERGESQRGEDEPLGRGAGHGKPFQLAVLG